MDTNGPNGDQRSSKRQASILEMYSVGYAAANLKVGQTELQVFPAEVRTFADGEVTDNVSDVTTSGKDAQGRTYSTKAQVSNAIKAKWLSRDSWLKFPGLVRRGEEVIIWRVGDTDQFYWELKGTTNHLRRRDVILIVVSNTDDESVTELTPNNSYFIEFNTVDKHITLMTATNDGEKVGYTMQLDTKKSQYAFLDTMDNAFILRSLDSFMQLINHEKSTFILDKTKILIKATDEVKIETNSFIAETKTTKMTGDKFTSIYPTTSWGGDSLTLNYSTGNGNIGNMTFNGNSVSFDTSSLFHNGKNIGGSHTHINSGGNGNGGPVA